MLIRLLLYVWLRLSISNNRIWWWWLKTVSEKFTKQNSRNTTLWRWHSREIGSRSRLRKTSADFWTVMQIRYRNLARKPAPIRTLPKPESDVKCAAWLVTGHSLHFHTLHYTLVMHYATNICHTHKNKQLLELLQKIRNRKFYIFNERSSLSIKSIVVQAVSSNTIVDLIVVCDGVQIRTNGSNGIIQCGLSLILLSS